jgi:hypothetical protein
MDQLKYGVLLSGLAGLVGCFLPLASGGPSLWDVHNADATGTFIVLGCFAVGALMGIIAVLKAPILRWQGLIALIAFVVVIIKMRSGFIDMIKEGGIGAKLIGIAPLAGALFAVLSMAFAAPNTGRR